MTITETVDFMKLIQERDNKRIIEYIDRMVEDEGIRRYAEGLKNGGCYRCDRPDNV